MSLGVFHAIVIVYHAVLRALLAPVVQSGTPPAQEAPPPGQVQKAHPLATLRAEEEGLPPAEAVVFVGQFHHRPLHALGREYLYMVGILVNIEILSTAKYSAPCVGVAQLKTVYAGCPLHLSMGLIPPPVIASKIQAYHFFLFLRLNRMLICYICPQHPAIHWMPQEPERLCLNRCRPAPGQVEPLGHLLPGQAVKKS